MLVPQGMAYAMLAGLPPVYGLYASTFPVLVYVLLGSSRHLAVGPVAIDSLLVMTAASNLATPGSADFITIAAILALLTGSIQFLLGTLRLGFLSNFISRAVITGFTTAAVLIIGCSQIRYLLDVRISGSTAIFTQITELSRHFPQTNFITLAIGMAGIAVLILCKWKCPRFPAALLVVVAGTLVVYAFKLTSAHVSVVGEVPKGLPAFRWPNFTGVDILALVSTAFVLAFVSFMEALAIGRMIAARARYQIDANRELMALGAANITSAVFAAFPIAGSFSRTAVNYHAGARTRLSSAISAVVIMLTLLFLIPLFYYLPKAVLAAIVLVAVVGLIDVNEIRHLCRIRTSDALTMLLAFVGVLLFGVVQGIAAGVVFSLLVFIWRSAYPHLAELGYVEEEDAFRDRKRYPQARMMPGVLILRIDASLYFANTAFVEENVRRRIAECPDVRWVILDLSGTNDIDTVAVGMLEELVGQYSAQDITFVFAGMKGRLRELARKAGWYDNPAMRLNSPTVRHALEEIGAFPPAVKGRETAEYADVRD